MIKIIKNIFAGAIIIFLLLISIQSAQTEDANQPKLDLQFNIDPNASPTQFSQVEEIISLINIQDEIDINDLPIVDNMDLYVNDDPSSIVYMYITVREGNTSDNTDHTWEEVNAFTDFFSGEIVTNFVGKTEVLLQIGNENGPVAGQIGYGELITNGTIKIRGNTTSLSVQKSYKIELRDRAGEWRGQTTIALNKHIFDITRLRNKLSFDLIIDIPDLISLRTQFVRLFVKDETMDIPSKEFVDYGLFTQIENPNKKFLLNHMLDTEGQLYKAKFFEFFRYPEFIRLKDDPLYSEDVFSSILDIKGSNDHTDLIQMLDDLNNYAIPIQTTFEKYFDLDNYFSWMAFNILIGDIDSQNQNYYIYSPQNGDKWYFIPWDYDGVLENFEDRMAGKFSNQLWETGIANYWGVVLHRRVLIHSEYRDMLKEKIKEVKLIISPERIEELVDQYRSTTEKYVFSMPDVFHARGTPEEYDLILRSFPDEIEINYQNYLSSLELPMPFFLGLPSRNEGNIVFNWGEAYNFNAGNINYTFEISTDWDFYNVIVEKTLLNLTSVEVNLLEPGNYFWRVTAINENGLIMMAFDDYQNAERDNFDGIKYFYITAEGEILEE